MGEYPPGVTQAVIDRTFESLDSDDDLVPCTIAAHYFYDHEGHGDEYPITITVCPRCEDIKCYGECAKLD